MNRGTFREDLFYRLNVFPITVPPLRERPEDIPALVQTFIEEFGEAMGKSIDRVPQAGLDELLEYDWPGNVRELRNLVERAMISTPGRTLVLPSFDRNNGHSKPALTFDEAQTQHLVETLKATRWRIRGDGGAAEVLDLKPTTLEYKMKKLGIRRADRRGRDRRSSD